MEAKQSRVRACLASWVHRVMHSLHCMCRHTHQHQLTRAYVFTTSHQGALRESSDGSGSMSYTVVSSINDAAAEAAAAGGGAGAGSGAGEHDDAGVDDEEEEEEDDGAAAVSVSPCCHYRPRCNS